MKDEPLLLALTALESTWGRDEPLVFLGEWCKRYERTSVWSARAHQTVPFHWDDREKLDRDYEYLARLHRSLLRRLSTSLNSLHGARHSVRYWQILLDPWLLSYVGVMFDRWESIAAALAGRTTLAYVPVGGSERRTPPPSYVEFVDLVNSDEWNQHVYQEMLERGFSGACVKRAAASIGTSARIDMLVDDVPRRRSMMSIALALIDGAIRRSVRRYHMVSLGAGFSPLAIIQLSSALGQVPRLFEKEFTSPSLAVAVDRPDSVLAALQLEQTATNAFERYLEGAIVADLPSCLVEDFNVLRQRAEAVTLKAKVIVTGGHHWKSALSKAWMAEQVESGVKLVVAEHGGSLPPRRELFDFEVDISDIRTTWFTPYHPKHVQLPAPKLIRRFSELRRDSGGEARWCSIVSNECCRWVHRAHFYPMAHQWSTSFEMIGTFHDALDDRIKAAFRVKPYPADQGWNTRARFVDRFGPAKVLAPTSLDQVFANSRVVVCTYPETTFAEAMASGVPAILIYPSHLYELNAVAMPLLEQLMAAGIVFHDAAVAASHINAIWASPQGWWAGADVRQARDAFERMALGLSGDWLNQWSSFLKTLSA